jgi:sterol desaturase/sphingolipid hydroxylase (fatty acid hydroxylase superfamily)
MWSHEARLHHPKNMQPSFYSASIVKMLSNKVLKVEHSKAAYWADFALYAAVIVAIILFLIMSAERIGFMQMSGFVLVGLLTWTFLEYAIHRFILHLIEPFKTWHTLHHLRPRALILAPTLLTTTLIGLLIFTPAFFLSSALPASAFTVGLLVGYFGYALTHHAIHHWPANLQVMRTRKRLHALHHMQGVPTNFGVTSTLWDRAFGSHRKL